MSTSAELSATPRLEMRYLGRTGLKASEIGFGAWGIGGGYNIGGRAIGYGDVSDETSLAALQRAFELGVNFVDTADAYGAGRSETLVGAAIKLAARRILVATKVGNVRRDPDPSVQDFSAAYIKQACEKSLERLGITMIDLYQLHNPPRAVLENDEVWDTLRDLKNKNRIAHYGVSVNHPDDGLIAIEKGDVATVQVVYNLLARKEVKALFELAEKKSVGIIARVPLAAGMLSGKIKPGQTFPKNDHRHDNYPPGKLEAALTEAAKYRFLAENTGRTMAQAALKFCLAHPAVSVVIPGIKTPEQADESIRAANVPALTKEELARIDAL